MSDAYAGFSEERLKGVDTFNKAQEAAEKAQQMGVSLEALRTHVPILDGYVCIGCDEDMPYVAKNVTAELALEASEASVRLGVFDFRKPMPTLLRPILPAKQVYPVGVAYRGKEGKGTVPAKSKGFFVDIDEYGRQEMLVMSSGGTLESGHFNEIQAAEFARICRIAVDKKLSNL